MISITTVVQIIIALGIFNVWILRFNKPTDWRGGDAASLKEEFKIYGLPGWSVRFVGFIKVLSAIGLIVGIWLPELVLYSAAGIAVLMIGAIAMHVKVKDAWIKSLPAFALLILSLFLVFA